MTRMSIRPIEPGDNAQVRDLIWQVMTEFEATGPGYAVHDPEVDQMYESYDNDRSRFFVVAHEGRVLGCGGIGPLKGGDSRTCELRKMYFLKETRGLGLGAQMLNICLDEARRLGYQECYLETLHRMDRARSLYLKNGFIELSAPKGSTGHGACELSYLKDLRS